jgi:hypothetical protein
MMTENPDIKKDYLKEKVRKYQMVKKAIELMQQEHEKAIKPLEDLVEGLNQQIMGFMQQLGIRFIKTEYGDPGIYTKSSYSVRDQEAFKTHVTTSKEWDLLVWGVRRTSAESYFTLHNTYPPGVNVTKEQKLRITAPTPLGRKRTPKKIELAGSEEDFDAFEE